MKQVEQRLVAWAQQSLADANLHAKVHTSLPQLPAEDAEVCLVLKDILPQSTPSNRPETSHAVRLRYVIFAQAETRGAGNALLEALLFKALASTEFDVELTPIADSYWQALQIPAQPAFGLLVAHRQIRETLLAKPVAQPLQMRITPAVRLSGHVLVQLQNQTMLPLAGAQVALAHANISVLTDDDGRFRFAAIPPKPTQKELIVHYKNIIKRVVVAVSSTPVEIVLRTEEI